MSGDHAQFTRQQWDALRARRFNFERYFSVSARPWTTGCDESAAAADRYDLMRRKYRELVMSMPVPRDPLGFRVMHENWNRRRGHVLARVQQRKRAAMVRAPGEGLLAFVDRKCGFVRDAA